MKKGSISVTPRAGRIVTTRATQDVWQYENDWAHDLCDCCENIKQCCYAYWCFPCFLCQIFDRVNECLCTPCFVPYALMSLRSQLRTGFRIQGSLCEDCLSATFCPFCVAIQMENELEKQGL